MDAEQISAYNRRYYWQHKDEIAIRRINRRLGPLGVQLTMDGWLAVKAAHSNKCANCGEEKPLGPYYTGTEFLPLCNPCGSRHALDRANANRIAKWEKEQYEHGTSSGPTDS